MTVLDYLVNVDPIAAGNDERRDYIQLPVTFRMSRYLRRVVRLAIAFADGVGNGGHTVVMFYGQRMIGRFAVKYKASGGIAKADIMDNPSASLCHPNEEITFKVVRGGSYDEYPHQIYLDIQEVRA